MEKDVNTASPHYTSSVGVLSHAKDLVMTLRVAHWVKNLFLYIPLFFAGELFVWAKVWEVTLGVAAFCLVASGIYILNDYKDLEKDRLHPVKRYRPMAAGRISMPVALVLMAACLTSGLLIGWYCGFRFLIILTAYLLLNVCYSFGLKNVSILDILIISTGFILRVKGGGILGRVDISQWLMVIVFLLSLFLTLGKRRDDLLIKEESGASMRQSLSGYNAEFLNVGIGVTSAIIIMTYLMYTLSPEANLRLDTHRLYYTSVFVGAGLMRYLQLIYVNKTTRSPIRVFYEDRFIQICLALWVLSFYFLIYFKNFHLTPE